MPRCLALTLMVGFSLVLAVCGGVSDEELAAVQQELQTEQARVQELESEVIGLQQRLTQGAAISQVFGTVIGGFEEAGEAGWPSAEAIRNFSSLIQASGDPALQNKWVEILDSVLAGTGPPPPEAVAGIMAVVQASGNAELGDKLRELLIAMESGEGGAAFLELDAAVRAGPRLRRPRCRRVASRSLWDSLPTSRTAGCAD